MKTRPRRPPAAAFVITLALGCKRESPYGPDARRGGATPEPQAPTTATVIADTDGSCLYRLPGPSCPEGASCNPPAPERIECPPELRKAGMPAADPARPVGKEQWFRIPPELVATPFSGCFFRVEGYCAPVAQARCEPGETVKVPCAAIDPTAPPNARRYALASFSYRDSFGACRRVPATECSATSCPLPATAVVSCP